MDMNGKKKQVIRLNERQLKQIVKESVKRILAEDENYVDKMVRKRRSRFDNSKLKEIFDILGLTRNGEGYSIGGDLGYISLKLYKQDVEFREYSDGRVFMVFGYDSNAGAWGGYTRKCEVKDLDIFKRPDWKQILISRGSETKPDVIMI